MGRGCRGAEKVSDRPGGLFSNLCNRRAAQTLKDFPTLADTICTSSILPAYQLTQSERFREVRCRAVVATDAPQRLTARGPASSWLEFEFRKVRSPALARKLIYEIGGTVRFLCCRFRVPHSLCRSLNN